VRFINTSLGVLLCIFAVINIFLAWRAFDNGNMVLDTHYSLKAIFDVVLVLLVRNSE
jgi:multisubunit Na+/H+ antiporter MnhG subunit